MRAYLEAATSNGTINFAHSETADRYYSAETGAPPYIAVDFSKTLLVFDTTGNVRIDSSAAVLAHELGHLLAGEPAEGVGYKNGIASEDDMNGANFVYGADSVDFENQVMHQIDQTYSNRSSYNASFYDDDARLSQLDGQTEFTGGQYVDITRIGVISDDNMDLSARTDGKSALMMGFSGDDTIIGGAGNDYLYGMTGEDIVEGRAGDDHLYGGDDNDRILGGDGDDYIVGGGGRNTINGGDGNDTIYSGADNILESGIGLGILQGGDGDDVFHAKAGDVIRGGAGNDTFYLQSAAITQDGYDQLNIEEQSAYENIIDGYYVPIVKINGLDAGDRIYVDGRLLTGSTVEVANSAANYYGHAFDQISESYSWLQGSSIYQGQAGSECYDLGDGTGNSGGISLFQGNSYSDGYGGGMMSINTGLVIALSNIKSGAGGLTVSYEIDPAYNSGTISANPAAGLYSMDSDYNPVHGSYFFA
jgi:Ca2+-binding RTX toxin-like protein